LSEVRPNSKSGYPMNKKLTRFENIQAQKMLTLALAGNANVGKSAIFNQLIGLRQETGNWAGKTVEAAQGTLVHHNQRISIIDLPGIYSFSTYSDDERISREFILKKHPDAVINIIDATSLERNLYFTLQLVEMQVPLVIALNFADIAGKKHINIDGDALGRFFDVPVVKTVAVKGTGVHEVVDEAMAVIIAARQGRKSTIEIKYGPEIESKIDKLNIALSEKNINTVYRWTSLKLLEGDAEVIEEINLIDPQIIQLASALSGEIASIHGEDTATVIASERYATAAKIARQVTMHPQAVTSSSFGKLDSILMHPVGGYIIILSLMVIILVIISLFGGWITNLITLLFEALAPQASGPLADILWHGAVVGFYASLSVALGFIFPFYLILGALGESGYLPRLAFLMDRPCHTLGLHGQAIMPLLLGFGCNVPACLACRIMDNRRDRLLAIFLTSLVPCSARTSVVLGLVGAFVGLPWAMGLLVFQFILIAILGRLLNHLFPSTSPGIIMEIPEYRVPSPKIVFLQGWMKFKDFLIIGIPLIVFGSVVIESLRVFNYLDSVTQFLTPLTVTWLGLPAFTSVLLIFGILRKESALALLITFAGGAAISTVMSPVQMLVFSLVMMLYIPCISTIAVLVKESGVKITVLIVAVEIGLAVVIGGIAYRVFDVWW
jgi:ferrous iron transport protein B